MTPSHERLSFHWLERGGGVKVRSVACGVIEGVWGGMCGKGRVRTKGTSVEMER